MLDRDVERIEQSEDAPARQQRQESIAGRRQAVLTFDVELFFGKEPGSVEDAIAAPLRTIISTMRAYDARGIFFIDTLFLAFLEKHDGESFQRMKDILSSLHRAGHVLGLHLHPHWLDARYESGRIVFPTYERFRLHALSDEAIDGAFREGSELLGSITGKSTVHFRAGGWSIMPFDRLRQFFQRYGIKVDSSVVPGMAADNKPLHYYAYPSTTPAAPYPFSVDVLKRELRDGEFTEVPVTTFRIPNILLAVNYALNALFGNRRMSRGSGVQQPSSKRARRSLFRTRTVYLETEKFHPLVFRLLMRLLRKRRPIVLAIHPKGMRRLSHRNLSYVCSRFSVVTDTL
jgi:peptidoglycan/xylan/chitin deacetylase (PgdA/CDA1 family)